MLHDTDRHQFDNAAPITTTTTTPSNVVPLRPDLAEDQQSTANGGEKDPGREPRPKHYLAPTAKLDILFAKDIDPDLSPMARRVLTVILAHRNKETGEAFVGEDEIARILGTKRRQSITDAIGALVKAGWITKERKRKSSRAGSLYGSNHYTVLMYKVDAILTKAGISFTNGRRKADNQGTVSREDEDDQGTFLRVGNARFSDAEDNAKPCDNQPKEPAKVNPPREPKGSLAAAQQARAPAASPSSGKFELPEDFQPDPVAVKEALDKGCTPEQIERSLGIWRGKNVGKRFTLAEWTRKASKWLKIEKVGSKPVPDTMGTLLPAGWLPTIDPRDAAREFGLSVDELNHELDAFRKYYRSQSGHAALKRDWDMAFEGWLLKEAKAKRLRAEAEKRRIANRY